MKIEQSQAITETTFEEALAAIRADQIYPQSQRGLDGYLSVRLYRAENARYLARYDEQQVLRDLHNGTDIVVCTQDREIILNPRTPSTTDRPVKFCGCDPDGDCCCLNIITARSTENGFTLNLSDHRWAALCHADSHSQDDQEDQQDLHHVAAQSHNWTKGDDEPPQEMVGKPGAGRLYRGTEACR